MRLLILACLLVPDPGGPVPPSPDPILDLTTTAEAERWIVVNDGVMGGLSRGRLEFPPGEPAVFSGTVSLENNGGFASVRSLPRELGLEGMEGVVLRVRGDGSVYQFRARTDDGFDGVAYQTSFPTLEGEWQEIPIRFEDLVASFRGRRVRAPELDPASIRQFGFLIADKQEGSFRLEIDRILPLPPNEAEDPAKP